MTQKTKIIDKGPLRATLQVSICYCYLSCGIDRILTAMEETDKSGPEVIKLFSCSSQLSIKF